MRGKSVLPYGATVCMYVYQRESSDIWVDMYFQRYGGPYVVCSSVAVCCEDGTGEGMKATPAAANEVYVRLYRTGKACPPAVSGKICVPNLHPWI